MKLATVILVTALLAGCISGHQVRALDPGMTQDEVTQILGKPDGFKQRGEYITYKYTNILISGWSWDRTDYSFIFKNGKLIEYGPGEVRERNIGGVHSVFLYRM